LSTGSYGIPDFYIVPSKIVLQSIVGHLKALLKKDPKIQIADQLLAWGYYGIEKEGGKQYKNNWEILEQ
jgi:hypothetical protein